MNDSSIVLTISQGKLKGRKDLDVYNKAYYSFQSVPYAKQPLNELRFKPPEAAEPWLEEIFDATIDGTVICPTVYAHFMQHLSPKFGEDCLRLNIYTPANLKSSLKCALPVMVEIHGGAFIFGSSHRDDYGPDFLMSKNVVLVTINYRVGILGFLKLKDSSLNVAGNAGLKDIVEALKWIKKNICHFGGDPNNVTVFGGSMGGTAAHLLTVSPIAKGLFHKVICQSGTAINETFSSRRDDSKVAQILGFKSTDSHDILNFLQKANIQDLLDAELKITKQTVTAAYQFTRFRPIIEENHPSSFLTESPLTLIKKGEFYDCPILTGTVENDGTIMESLSHKFKPNFSNGAIPLTEGIKNLHNLSSTELVNKIEHLLYLHCYQGQTPSYKNKQIYYQISSDIIFNYPPYKLVKLLDGKLKSPIYLYKMKLNTKLNMKPGQYKHLDDERYLFSRPSTKSLIQIGSDEEKAMNLVTTLWTNFARTGDPNPNPINSKLKWEPVSAHRLNFFKIELDPDTDEDFGGYSLKFLEHLFNLNSKL